MRLPFALALLAIASAEEPAVWKAGPPLFLPGPAGAFDETAVKDPSIVFAGGQWRLFYTARGRGRYAIGYAAAPSLDALRSAPHHHLAQLRGEKEDYAAAPQVFYFRPQKKWYLLYQTTDAWYRPVFSTTTEIDKSESWARPKPFVIPHPEKEKWIDFWVICDDRDAYLFFTRSHREVVVMTTALADFPNGFHDPKIIPVPVHEAAHVYRVQGGSYEMLFELADGSLRKYARATAPALAGPWHTDTLDYATGPQLRFDSATAPWTAEVSHGELLRSGFDERLEVSAHTTQFLIQGIAPDQHQGDYPALPWRLGLIRKNTP